MTKVLYSGHNSRIPYLLWRKGFSVFAKPEYNWESWCYGYSEKGIPKSSPAKFSKHIFKEIKSLKVHALVIYRGADKSQAAPSIQPNFWHVDPNALNNLMDSGITVAILNNSNDPYNSLDYCELPRCCHFYKNDANMSDIDMAILLGDKLPALVKKVDARTAPCCRGKYL